MLGEVDDLCLALHLWSLQIRRTPHSLKVNFRYTSKSTQDGDLEISDFSTIVPAYVVISYHQQCGTMVPHGASPMPALDNIRHERFCLLVAKGKHAADAYAQAGFKASNPDLTSRSASKLLKRDDVMLRLRELQAKEAKR